VQNFRLDGKFELWQHLFLMAEQPDFSLLSLGIRRIGWIRFWSQTVLGVVVVGLLLFSNVGSMKNSEKVLGLSPGLSLTTLAFLLLLYSLWQCWLIIRTGRALNSSVRPSRGETSRLLKRGLIVDLLGLVFSVIGYQALAGALFVQASMQAQGIALGATLRGMNNYPITSLEMLSVLSNTQVLFAHTIGLSLSLWMLQRIYRTK